MSTTPSAELFSSTSLALAVGDATRHLLAGVREINSPDWHADIGQAGFSLLATGVEKLAKLTLMVHGDVTTGAFLTDQDMRKDQRHNIASLTAEVDQIIATHTTSTSGYLATLLQAMREDAYWPAMVDLLDVAADATRGRYLHARGMSGVIPEHDSPAAQWEHLALTAAREANLLGALSNPATHAQASAQIRTRPLEALLRWWHLIYRAWQHGAVGERGRQVSSDISLDLARVPAPWTAFVESL